MTACFVRGVSVWGPGLALWPQARAVLRAEAAWVDAGAPPPPPALLAPNERRRAGLPTRLALAVCEEAVTQSGLPASDLACVFASANGEGSVVHGLLETLAGPDRQVSPTQFHNSVHNAVSGYWSIATKSMQPVTCLACGDHSFAAGLLQAAAVCVRAGTVLLCAYDAPIPLPLGHGRPTTFAFAAAFVMSAQAGGDAPRIDVRSVQAALDTPPHDEHFRALMPGNAAARALRLLEALARRLPDTFHLALPGGGLEIAVC